MTGKVKFFNEVKGWGILTGDDGVEVFVHFKNIAVDGFRTLKQDQLVSYDTATTDKGLQAVNVVPVK
jgi:CspA family cold shock protein